MYDGEQVQALHFQMRKGFKGITKKYVVLNLSTETEEYRNTMDGSYEEEWIGEEEEDEEI